MIPRILFLGKISCKFFESKVLMEKRKQLESKLDFFFEHKKKKDENPLNQQELKKPQPKATDSDFDFVAVDLTDDDFKVRNLLSNEWCRLTKIHKFQPKIQNIILQNNSQKLSGYGALMLDGKNIRLN
jgi:hypothetical protein